MFDLVMKMIQKRFYDMEWQMCSHFITVTGSLSFHFVNRNVKKCLAVAGIIPHDTGTTGTDQRRLTPWSCGWPDLDVIFSPSSLGHFSPNLGWSDTGPWWWWCNVLIPSTVPVSCTILYLSLVKHSEWNSIIRVRVSGRLRLAAIICNDLMLVIILTNVNVTVSHQLWENLLSLKVY